MDTGITSHQVLVQNVICATINWAYLDNVIPLQDVTDSTPFHFTVSTITTGLLVTDTFEVLTAVPVL
jgi:hypothetical protein